MFCNFDCVNLASIQSPTAVSEFTQPLEPTSYLNSFRRRGRRWRWRRLTEVEELEGEVVGVHRRGRG